MRQGHPQHSGRLSKPLFGVRYASGPVSDATNPQILYLDENSELL